MPRAPKNKPTEKPPRIPRPANCFMIFRADWLRISKANGSHERQKQMDVSRGAAAAWRNLSPTLKQLYQIQAGIIREEHREKYPGWTYQPKTAKKEKKRVVDDDIIPDGSPTECVASGRTATPHQKPSVDTEEKRNAKATPFTPINGQTKFVWDRSWFSGGSSMKDPFYSAALQPLTSESPTALPPVVPAHPHLFLPPAQVHGLDMAPNLHATPPMYYPKDDDRSALPPASNALGLSDLRSLPQATTQAKPLVSDHLIHPSNSTGDSTPTAGSSAGEVPTPVSEVEPPTQSLLRNSGLTYEKFLENFYNSSDWVANPAFNPDFDLFLMTGL